MLLTWQKDTRHNKQWFGHYCLDSAALLVSLAEPLTEKSKSYKCEGDVEAVFQKGQMIPSMGKLLIYFSKDSFTASLRYGDKIVINKPLQPIKNSGNPGGFNYERYAAFQQIFHNVYLKGSEVILLKQKNSNPAKVLIFSTQKYIIDVLQKYLPADKNVLGIAEALLIGYKEDLDKDLVQAYSNTGVVHIIAISGLHLGLIYVMLVWIFTRLPIIKRSRFLKVFLVLGSLWFFALLTGASASVLRSAVMFTCIVIGKNYFTRSSIYNSLAASAFILLCYDPYFLWDVGFQLSYLAVIGIVWLQKPICHSIYFKNKHLGKLWNMAAVTLAAQVITFPICIYYFHQFPNLFLITNLLAVPLSTVILFAEIFLIAFSWFNIVGMYAGKIISILVWFMNIIIQSCNDLPFSRLDNIYSNVLSTWLLYSLVISSCYWIIYKNKSMYRVALICLFGFSILQAFTKFNMFQQKKLIIYNVPQHNAMDFISGNKYFFLGDSILQQDGVLQNFHLKPTRISMQLDNKADHINGLFHINNYWQYFNKKIIMIDSPVYYEPLVNKLYVDIVIISKNPTLEISGITAAIRPSIILFDSSNSLWKIGKWKKECLALALPCFSIPEQGAFVLNID
jgi:competence protein ComEC